MGEYLRESGRRMAPRSGPSTRFGREGGSALVIVLAVIGIGLSVAGVARGSFVAIAGALLVLGSAVAWWQSDRAGLLPDGAAARLFRELPEAKLAALSVVALLVGLATALIGIIKGW